MDLLVNLLDLWRVKAVAAGILFVGLFVDSAGPPTMFDALVAFALLVLAIPPMTRYCPLGKWIDQLEQYLKRLD